MLIFNDEFLKKYNISINDVDLYVSMELVLVKFYKEKLGVVVFVIG